LNQPDCLSPITRRGFLRAASFAAGALITGCGPRGVPGARVTLTQWYHQYGETGTQEAVLRYAREYTRQHPDIAIRVLWVPGDYGTKLATSLLTGGPDVFEGSLTAAMVRAGQVAPLDELFTPSVRAEFSPKDIAVNTVGGRIYGVKMLDDVGFLYYRKSQLTAAGIEPPATMDALIAAANKLTVGDRKGLFIGNDGGVNALLTLLPWSAGSDFLVGNKIVFNNPRTQAAYEKLSELNASGSLLIGAPTDYWDPSAFTQGLTALQWTGLWAYPAIRKAFGDDIGVVPWPALDAAGTPVTFLGGWSQMVNAQGAHIEEAKAFVKWLWIESTQLQQDWSLNYGLHVPPRTSLVSSAPQLQGAVPLTAASALRKYGRFLPPDWDQSMTTALTDALTNALKRGQPMASELSAAADKCTRELERALE